MLPSYRNNGEMERLPSTSSNSYNCSLVSPSCCEDEANIVEVLKLGQRGWIHSSWYHYFVGVLSELEIAIITVVTVALSMLLGLDFVTVVLVAPQLLFFFSGLFGVIKGWPDGVVLLCADVDYFLAQMISQLSSHIDGIGWKPVNHCLSNNISSITIGIGWLKFRLCYATNFA